MMTVEDMSHVQTGIWSYLSLFSLSDCKMLLKTRCRYAREMLMASFRDGASSVVVSAWMRIGVTTQAA